MPEIILARIFATVLNIVTNSQGAKLQVGGFYRLWAPVGAAVPRFSVVPAHSGKQLIELVKKAPTFLMGHELAEELLVAGAGWVVARRAVTQL
ncbi:hypothetical protein, partial [Pseudomonas sp. FW305-55]